MTLKSTFLPPTNISFLKHSLLLAFFISIIANVTAQSKTAKDAKPNIIFILTDDLGYGDISTFNPEGKIPTPNIDKLAETGVKFTDAHTSSSVCTPTRYGILTGRYNWRSSLKNGVLTGKSKALIPNDRSTVASMLKGEGYATGFVGKWHLGWDWAHKGEKLEGGEGWDPGDFENIDFSKKITNSPNDLGFEYAYGHSGSLDMAPYVYVENEMSTSIPTETTVNKGKYSWWREGPTASDFVHEQVTPHFFDKAGEFITKSTGSDKPFFLYLALPSPHTPILPLEKWQGISGLNPYADFVMMIDDYIGALTDNLKKKGIFDNTLIIFTSDNGCSPAAKIEEMTAKDHFPSYVFRGHKADIFEGGHRVPFIVSWPAGIEKASVSSKLICTTDFFATAGEIAGHNLKQDEAEDSFSYLEELTGEKSTVEQRTSLINHSINGSFAFRKDEWKLIFCGGSGGWSAPRPGKKEILDSLPKYQLYNLTADQGEQNNLYLEMPAKADELRSEFFEVIRNGRSNSGPVQSNDPGFKGWPQLEKVISAE